MGWIMQRWYRRSLKLKLIIGVLVLTIPLILVIIFGSQYAISVVRSQVSDSYKNLTTLYMQDIDQELEKVDKFMNGLVYSNMDLLAINQASNETDYYRAKISLFSLFTENLVLYPAINSFFMYSPEWNDFMTAQAVPEDYEKTLSIQDYIIQLLDNTPNLNGFYSNSWEAHEIDGEFYIIHIMVADDVYFGSWQKAEHLMIPLNFISFGNMGGSMFATSEGVPMTNEIIVKDNAIQLTPISERYQLSGEENKFLIVGEGSKKGNFSLIAIIPDEQILEKLPYLEKLAFFAIVASILITPIGLYLLRKVVLVPINQLLIAMKRIREGNLSFRMGENSTSSEFEIVNQTFNSMMSQIQELTVNVYEEKLNKQREELQRLQLQINPHFFLNSLNIIYHLAKVKDYELIKEMSQCLVRYFRFMFRSNLSFIHLKDELEHTENYLRIQELRFPGQLIYTVDVPEYLATEFVPPLIIQTFVENTIKHAVTLDHPIEVFIRGDIIEQNNRPYLKISVEDTGEGFPDEVLRGLQTNHSLTTDEGEHIGIWNVQRRIKLLYGDDAMLVFSKLQPHGASVSIILPIQKVEAGKEREVVQDV